MPKQQTSIKTATIDDIPRVREIYAHYVENTTISLEETAPDLAEKQSRYQKITAQGLPYLIAQNDAGGVIGYAYALPYRPRPGYRYTLEESVYVDPKHSGQGVGSALLNELCAQAAAKGYKQMISVITGKPDSPSCNFHKKCNFEIVGTLKNVGFKQNQWLDTIFMQKDLG